MPKEITKHHDILRTIEGLDIIAGMVEKYEGDARTSEVTATIPNN